MARSAFAQLKLVRQLHPFLEMSDLATVTHALVTSHFDYCNALCVGLPLKTVQKLQLVQNSAARRLTGASYREPITHLSQDLHWLPVRFRAQFKVLAVTYKALYSLGPGYLKDRISLYSPSWRLKSAEEPLLLVPLPAQAQLMGTRERAFSVAAPRLWNSLPQEIRMAPSLLSF